MLWNVVSVLVIVVKFMLSVMLMVIVVSVFCMLCLFGIGSLIELRMLWCV